jgi:hypothetical protein
MHETLACYCSRTMVTASWGPPAVPSLPPNSPAQYPSHHLEPAVAAGQLLPRLRAVLDHPVPSLTKASCHPAAPTGRCQGRFATTMPVPSTR